MMGKINQEKVWNFIAKQWQEFRDEPMEPVKNFLKKQKGKILDLGCGSGRNFIKKSKLKFYGVDFSEELLKYAEKKNIAVELKRAQVTKIPYPSNFFDAAIFSAVLHCVKSRERREKSLRELLRVLKPKASALITVWGRNQKRLKNKTKESLIPWTVEGRKCYRYNYIFEKEELQSLLKKVGFKIKKITEDQNIIAIVEK